jgi:hypothetical protein
MDYIDIIPTYERLLREAAIASLEEDDFDLHSDDPVSVEEFAKLEAASLRAHIALLDFYYEESAMLRLLLGSQLVKSAKGDAQKALSALPREDLVKVLEEDQKTN